MEYRWVAPATENHAVPAVGPTEPWVCAGRPQEWLHPTAGVASVDARLFEGVFSRGPLNVVFRRRLGLIRADLLEALGPELAAEAFALGNVSGPDAGILANWRTYRGRHRIVVRGTKNVSWQRCEICGAIQYSHWGGRRFLWPKPDPQVPIFDDNGFLVFRADIAERVFRKKWIGVHIAPIRVADTARDGVAEFGAIDQPFG